MTAVAGRPDGTRLATASDDRTVRLWDPATGTTLTTLTGHTGSVCRGGLVPRRHPPRHRQRRRHRPAVGPRHRRQVGIRITDLPDGEVAVFDAATDELIGASDGAWRWLGYTVVQDGQLTRLPAETYGPLPPLTRS